MRRDASSVVHMGTSGIRYQPKNTWPVIGVSSGLPLSFRIWGALRCVSLTGQDIVRNVDLSMGSARALRGARWTMGPMAYEPVQR